MNKNIIFEMNKIKKYNKIVIPMTAIVQLSFLFFFTVVGKFASSGTDDILTNYGAIVGLSSTITIFIIIIYGAVIINHFVVCDFIGDSRARIYLYPDGRNKLYYRKIITFGIVFTFMLLTGCIIANIIYFLIESIFPILDTYSILLDASTFIISPIIVALSSTSMIVLASIIGIKYSSPVSTIIAGIILIVTLGNLISILFINYEYILLFIIILLTLLVPIGVLITGNNIKKDEVFDK